jgi:hypothetical protein
MACQSAGTAEGSPLNIENGNTITVPTHPYEIVTVNVEYLLLLISSSRGFHPGREEVPPPRFDLCGACLRNAAINISQPEHRTMESKDH